MKILVACEFSGTVRDAFIVRGHDAISCDLDKGWGKGPHYQGNVLDILDNQWDMMIAFPPCTHLTKARGKYRIPEAQDAVKFFLWLYSANIPRICIENPPGYVNSHIIKPSQTIQPWYFGSEYSKQTCLWLLGLPKLIPTKYNYTATRWTDYVRDAKERSITFTEVANAMAEQWG